jgi:hypothetical protein
MVSILLTQEMVQRGDRLPVVMRLVLNRTDQVEQRELISV